LRLVGALQEKNCVHFHFAI